MTTLSYPSEAFPAPVAFTIDVPSHWRNIETPDALVAAIDPTGTVFQSNITVAAERFEVTMSLHEIAAKVITDRNERLTQHLADEPIQHPSNESLQWTATFEVAVAGEPLVLKQWTMLLDQPETTPVRFVTVVTLTMPAADADDELAKQVVTSLTLL